MRTIDSSLFQFNRFQPGYRQQEPRHSLPAPVIFPRFEGQTRPHRIKTLSLLAAVLLPLTSGLLLRPSDPTTTLRAQETSPSQPTAPTLNPDEKSRLEKINQTAHTLTTEELFKQFQALPHPKIREVLLSPYWSHEQDKEAVKSHYTHLIESLYRRSLSPEDLPDTLQPETLQQKIGRYYLDLILPQPGENLDNNAHRQRHDWVGELERVTQGKMPLTSQEAYQLMNYWEAKPLIKALPNEQQLPLIQSILVRCQKEAPNKNPFNYLDPSGLERLARWFDMVTPETCSAVLPHVQKTYQTLLTEAMTRQAEQPNLADSYMIYRLLTPEALAAMPNTFFLPEWKPLIPKIMNATEKAHSGFTTDDIKDHNLLRALTRLAVLELHPGYQAESSPIFALYLAHTFGNEETKLSDELGDEILALLKEEALANHRPPESPRILKQSFHQELESIQLNEKLTRPLAEALQKILSHPPKPNEPYENKAVYRTAMALSLTLLTNPYRLPGPFNHLMNTIAKAPPQDIPSHLDSLTDYLTFGPRQYRSIKLDELMPHLHLEPVLTAANQELMSMTPARQQTGIRILREMYNLRSQMQRESYAPLVRIQDNPFHQSFRSLQQSLEKGYENQLWGNSAAITVLCGTLQDYQKLCPHNPEAQLASLNLLKSQLSLIAREYKKGGNSDELNRSTEALLSSALEIMTQYASDSGLSYRDLLKTFSPLARIALQELPSSVSTLTKNEIIDFLLPYPSFINRKIIQSVLEKMGNAKEGMIEEILFNQAQQICQSPPATETSALPEAKGMIRFFALSLPDRCVELRSFLQESLRLTPADDSAKRSAVYQLLGMLPQERPGEPNPSVLTLLEEGLTTETHPQVIQSLGKALHEHTLQAEFPAEWIVTLPNGMNDYDTFSQGKDSLLQRTESLNQALDRQSSNRQASLPETGALVSVLNGNLHAALSRQFDLKAVRNPVTGQAPKTVFIAAKRYMDNHAIALATFAREHQNLVSRYFPDNMIQIQPDEQRIPSTHQTLITHLTQRLEWELNGEFRYSMGAAVASLIALYQNDPWLNAKDHQAAMTALTSRLFTTPDPTVNPDTPLTPLFPEMENNYQRGYLRTLWKEKPLDKKSEALQQKLEQAEPLTIQEQRTLMALDPDLYQQRVTNPMARVTASFLDDCLQHAEALKLTQNRIDRKIIHQMLIHATRYLSPQQARAYEEKFQKL